MNEWTRRLGVAWRDRPDGLRELDGVDDDLIEMFSSRRRAITTHMEELAAAYRDKYGIEPPPAVLNAMGQAAWSSTRRRKTDPDPGELLERWEATARGHGQRLAWLPGRVVGRGRPTAPAAGSGPMIEQALGRLADGGQASCHRRPRVGSLSYPRRRPRPARFAAPDRATGRTRGARQDPHPAGGRRRLASSSSTKPRWSPPRRRSTSSNRRDRPGEGCC